MRIKSILGIIQEDKIEDTGFIKKFNTNIICQNHKIFTLQDEKILICAQSQNVSDYTLNISKYLYIEINELTREIKLINDPYGRETFYYLKQNNKFIYSNEIEWLLAYNNYQYKVDLYALLESIFLNFISPPRTFYENICSLANNKIMKIDYTVLDNIMVNIESCKYDCIQDAKNYNSKKIEYKVPKFDIDYNAAFDILPQVIWLCKHPNISLEEAYIYSILKTPIYTDAEKTQLMHEMLHFQVITSSSRHLSEIKTIFLNSMTKSFFKSNGFHKYIAEKKAILNQQDKKLINIKYFQNINNLIMQLNNQNLDSVIDEVPYLFNLDISNRESKNFKSFVPEINKRQVYDAVQRIFYDKSNILNSLFTLNPFSFNRFLRISKHFCENEVIELFVSLLSTNYLASMLIKK